ncbi:MAG: hypothetical protein HZB75_01910 [Candidatus Saccharibacteria bacterium]|jgi:hypothetical protein|nr:MAG: hypothetical protein HZB75_01910 [Candidatus Saccharibacteria bacterium]
MTKGDSSLVKITNQHGPSGFLFFVAYIGAVIYFFQQSPDFWGFILALLKAIVWPAFVMYHGLGALGV